MIRRPPRSTLFPYTDALPISRVERRGARAGDEEGERVRAERDAEPDKPGPGREVRERDRPDAEKARERDHAEPEDRKSTRLNSSHLVISYAVFCLQKKSHREL